MLFSEEPIGCDFDQYYSMSRRQKKAIHEGEHFLENGRLKTIWESWIEA